MKVYDLCHNCATAITNDDYSGLEFSSEDLADRVRAFAVSAGNVVLTGEIQSIDGHGHVAEAI